MNASNKTRSAAAFGIFALLSLILLLQGLTAEAQEDQKARVIILTDVENEHDDTESHVRLLLYSNAIDIKGIIATTSVYMKDEVDPEAGTYRQIIRFDPAENLCRIPHLTAPVVEKSETAHFILKFTDKENPPLA